MKVSELIELLKAFPSETPVVVGGFDEDGFDDPVPPYFMEIAQFGDGAGHCGKYDVISESEPLLKGESQFLAVVIDFKKPR